MLTAAIIYEDNHLLIAQKPPGWLAQPDGTARPDMLAWAEKYLARNKPGRAFVGLTHRLDRAVGGVMALAKTSKAAARLSAQFRDRTVGKLYLALVSGNPKCESDHLEQYLVRVGSVTRLAAPGEKGTLAILDWRLRRRFSGLALLEVDLSTGFKHQIRAQLSSGGLPILGDLKYGSPMAPKEETIGLWAESLTLDHPTTKERLTFKAKPLAVWPWNL